MVVAVDAEVAAVQHQLPATKSLWRLRYLFPKKPDCLFVVQDRVVAVLPVALVSARLRVSRWRRKRRSKAIKAITARLPLMDAAAERLVVEVGLEVAEVKLHQRPMPAMAAATPTPMT